MAGPLYRRRLAATGIVAALFTLAAGAVGTTASTAQAVSTARAVATRQGGAPIAGATETYAPSGAYTLTGGSARKSGGIYSATKTSESAVLIKGAANLKLTGCTIRKTGNSQTTSESSFYGLNAAVLAASPSQVTLSGCAITTDGTGANGVFAYGANSHVTVADSTIRANGTSNAAGDGHGVMAAGGGHVTLDNVNIATKGAHSADIATDRGGGSVTVYGGTMTAAGDGSPVIYSTGVIKVHHLTGTALNGQSAAVVEGHNSITAVDSHLTGSGGGVMLYQSFSGDAGAGKATFTMVAGSLTAEHGPAFYVQKTASKISLSAGAVIRAADGILISVANAGSLSFTASGERLEGDVVNASSGATRLSLKDATTLVGAITNASLTLDSSSMWIVTGNSTLTSLTGAKVSGSTVTNIVGNGHDVYYDKNLSASEWLGGKTYTLAGGGKLIATS
jgi:hypothetical protein